MIYTRPCECAPYLELTLYTCVTHFIWSFTCFFLHSTPYIDTFSDPRMWVDAITQNAFDTGAGVGVFVPYATYMTRQHNIIQYAIFVPIGNNLIRYDVGSLRSRVCQMPTPIKYCNQSWPEKCVISVLFFCHQMCYIYVCTAFRVSKLTFFKT